MRSKRFTPKVGMKLEVGYTEGEVVEVNKRYFVVKFGSKTGRVYRHKGNSAYRVRVGKSRLRVCLRKSYDEMQPMSKTMRIAEWLGHQCVNTEALESVATLYNVVEELPTYSNGQQTMTAYQPHATPVMPGVYYTARTS